MTPNDDQTLIDARHRQDADMHERAVTLMKKKNLTDADRREAQKIFGQFIEYKGDPDIESLEINRVGARSVRDWYHGKYQGDNDLVARQCMRRIDREFSGVELDVPFDFVRTRISDSIISVIRDAAINSNAATIFGSAGIGKTLSCKVAQQTVLNDAVHIECTQGARGPGGFVKLLARRLEAKVASRTVGEVEDSVIERLREKPTFLIIDEAHYLRPEALNVLRDIIKQAKVGCALVGTIDLDRAVDDGQEFYGQWTRLIVFRYDIVDETVNRGGAFFSLEEVSRFCKSCGSKVTGKGLERIAEYANIPGWGGLGQAANVLRKAELLADGGNINAEHIDNIIEQTHGRHYAARAHAQIRGMHEQRDARPRGKRSARKKASAA